MGREYTHERAGYTRARVHIQSMFALLPVACDELCVVQVSTHGDATMKECLQYVLHEAAGSSSTIFMNAPYPRDCDAHGLRADRRTATGEGMRLDDFVAHPHAQRSLP